MVKFYAFWGLLALLLYGCAAAGERDVTPPGQDPSPLPEASPETSNPPVSLEEATPVPTQPPAALVQLDDFGPAPELENKVWLNTDQPLRLADLRGQVVLLDMWTFG